MAEVTGAGSGLATALVEREDALAFLWNAFAAAQSGDGRVAVVAGEAGIGKTALVEAFAGEVSSRARVRRGVCDPLSSPRAHGPLRDIADSGSSELTEALARGADADTLRSCFLAELRARPVASVTVIEDLHWADEATLDLLRFTSRHLAATRALLVCTLREDELGPEHPVRMLLGDLAGLGNAVRVPIEPLSPAGVRTLAARAGRTLDADDLHRTTGGNPFFVTEILAVSDGDRVPATVRDAILARVAPLPAPSREVLDLVALSRPPVDARTCLRALATTPSALDDALAAGVLVADGAGVRFRHDLARQVVADAVSPGRRLDLHGRALAELATDPRTDPADLAHHAEGTGDPAAILLHARNAAVHAVEFGAHRQAVQQYERALQVAGNLPIDEQADLLERHSLACYAVGDPATAVSSRRRAVELRRDLPDRRALGDGLRWLSRLLWVDGRTPEAAEVGREALEVLAGSDACRELAMAHSNLSQLAMLARDIDGAIEHGRSAIAMAERVHDSETIVHALNNVGSATLLAGHIDEGLRDLSRSRDLALEHGFDDHAARAWCNLGSALGEARHYDEALPNLHAGIDFCREHHRDYYGHYLRAWLARVHLEQGQWREAESEAAAVLELPTVAPVTQIVARTVLGSLAVRRGDPGLSEDLEIAWDLASSTGDLQRTWPVAAALAEQAWWQGDADAVDRWTCDLLAEARLRSHEWAVGELAAWRRRAGLPGALTDGAARPFRLAAAGRHREAAAAWTSRGAPYDGALAVLDAVDVDLVLAGHVLARDLGARPLADLLAQRVRALGGSVPRGPRSASRTNPAGLTPRQLEVLTLLAAGRSDAEIGVQLFISTRTAGHHVSAILRKLGVRSRTEAALAAVDLELAPAPTDA